MSDMVSQGVLFMSVPVSGSWCVTWCVCPIWTVTESQCMDIMGFK